MQPEERRPLLDRQLIKREMRGRFRYRKLEFVAPHRGRLIGTGVDQVEGVTVERLACDGDRVERLAGAVQPSQFLQRGVVERLHAERGPVDAGGAISGKTRR